MRKDNKNKGRQNRRKEYIKCDFCDNTSKDTKIYSKKNYPHGRKSKAVVTRKCWACKYPEKAKESEKIFDKAMQMKLNKEKEKWVKNNGRK